MGSNLKGFGICMIKGQSKKEPMLHDRGRYCEATKGCLGKVILLTDINMDPQAVYAIG